MILNSWSFGLQLPGARITGWCQYFRPVCLIYVKVLLGRDEGKAYKHMSRWSMLSSTAFYVYLEKSWANLTWRGGTHAWFQDWESLWWSNQQEFNTSLCYIVSLRPVCLHSERVLVSKPAKQSKIEFQFVHYVNSLIPLRTEAIDSG